MQGRAFQAVLVVDRSLRVGQQPPDLVDVAMRCESEEECDPLVLPPRLQHRNLVVGPFPRHELRRVVLPQA
eukprot:764383-Hanusia_phi.AAC.1